MTEVAIVGGGLAGLVTAGALARAGRDVRLLERRETLGGRVRTRRQDGFTLDRGFQVLFTGYPALRRQLDLGALELREFAPGAVLARPGKRSRLADPRRAPGDLLATLANDEVRTADKLRLLRLQRRLRQREAASLLPGPARSIAEHLDALGFSRSFIRHFAAPFYGGITLDRSLTAAAGVFEYTLKMLSEGAIAVPADGMGAIPAQLADRARAAGASLETGVRVRDVTPEPGGVRLETTGGAAEAEAVVVAADPPAAHALTGIDEIPRTGRGCVTQYFALPADVDLPTGNRLLLNVADPQPNHVAPLSAVAPEYAPTGRQLLGATFLGRPAADDETLADRTRSALAAWFPTRSFGDLELLHTDRIAFAQFAQPPGCHEDLPDVGAPGDRVFLAGDYTEWSSIQGAMRSGERAATAVDSTLG